MAGRFVQVQAAPDGLVQSAPEILLVGQPASHWPWVLALQVDSLAHRVATDSSSVWEAPAPTSRRRASVRPQQASLRQTQEMLHGARPQERRRAASRQQVELAVAPEELMDAPAVWQRLGLTQD
jgi:hypothetical protein